MADKVRKTALAVLTILDKDRFQTLDAALDTALSKNTRLSKRDRALLQILVYGVLRWRARLDWIIGYFSKTRLEKVDPKVLNILRLGIFQIIYLSRIPVSAAVNTSVEMAKSHTAPWVARYVNGLLRHAARTYQQVPFPAIEKDPVSALAAEKSFPDWLIKKWLHRFGLKETVLLCDAINTIPPARSAHFPRMIPACRPNLVPMKDIPDAANPIQSAGSQTGVPMRLNDTPTARASMLVATERATRLHPLVGS